MDDDQKPERDFNLNLLPTIANSEFASMIPYEILLAITEIPPANQIPSATLDALLPGTKKGANVVEPDPKKMNMVMDWLKTPDGINLIRKVRARGLATGTSKVTANVGNDFVNTVNKRKSLGGGPSTKMPKVHISNPTRFDFLKEKVSQMVEDMDQSAGPSTSAASAPRRAHVEPSNAAEALALLDEPVDVIWRETPNSLLDQLEFWAKNYDMGGETHWLLMLLLGLDLPTCEVILEEGMEWDNYPDHLTRVQNFLEFSDDSKINILIALRT